MGHGSYMQAHPEAKSNYDVDQGKKAVYPHDGSEVLGTLGARQYRCHRGNCSENIGHPVNQDSHNASAHM